MSSGEIPSRIHHTDRRDKRPSDAAANGSPLSVRIRTGNPYSVNARRKTAIAAAVVGARSPWQRIRNRLQASHTVSG